MYYAYSYVKMCRVFSECCLCAGSHLFHSSIQVAKKQRGTPHDVILSKHFCVEPVRIETSVIEIPNGLSIKGHIHTYSDQLKYTHHSDKDTTFQTILTKVYSPFR